MEFLFDLFEKKKLFIFIFFIFVFSENVCGSGLQKDIQPPAFEKVRSFDGYLFYVLLVDHNSVIDVSFVHGKINDDGKKILKTKYLFSVNSKFSVSDQKTVVNELLAFSNFKPVTTVASGGLVKDGDLNLLRFDSLDNLKRVRISQWFDVKTFFRVKVAEFSEQGELLSVSFYSRLRINPEQYSFLETPDAVVRKVALKYKTKDFQNENSDPLIYLDDFRNSVIEDLESR